MTDFLSETPDTKTDTRKPWITPEIKELASAQDAQGGRNLARSEIVLPVPLPFSYRPS